RAGQEQLPDGEPVADVAADTDEESESACATRQTGGLGVDVDDKASGPWVSAILSSSTAAGLPPEQRMHRRPTQGSGSMQGPKGQERVAHEVDAVSVLDEPCVQANGGGPEVGLGCPGVGQGGRPTAHRPEPGHQVTHASASSNASASSLPA